MTKKKVLALIGIFCLILSLSIINLNIRSSIASTPFNPPPDPPNENIYWDFDVGRIVAWETSCYNGTELLSGPLRTVYNISDITYFNNYKGSGVDYYGIILTHMFFNPRTNLMEELPSYIFNCSLVNFTYGGVGDFVGFDNMALFEPIFIPINGTDGLIIKWCAERMKDEFTFFLGGDLNPIISLPELNTILLENSMGSGEFVKLIFYNNGTLKSGEFHTTISAPIPYTLTIHLRRVFDFNPIDDIEWVVDIGDVFYTGSKSLFKMEYKIKIIDFINSIRSSAMGLTSFQEVRANIFRWNWPTDSWILSYSNITIAIANEDLLMTTGEYFMSGQPLLVPKGTKGYELYNLLYNIRMYVPNFYSEYSINFDECWINIVHKSSQEIVFYLEYYSNGIIKYLYNTIDLTDFDQGFLYFKNSTIIEGSYNFKISPHCTTDFNVNVEISVFDITLLLFAGLVENPTPQHFKDSLLYIDLFINKSSNLRAPVNITINFDGNKYKVLEVWCYNLTTLVWEKAHFTDLGHGIILIRANHVGIFALVGIEKQKPNIIPFGNFYLIYLGIAIIGLTIYKKYK
ncbi:MAG: hypothetical protein ACFFA4_08695 [Promethearchaeota archaeon]